jgi:hypothetical protein
MPCSALPPHKKAETKYLVALLGALAVPAPLPATAPSAHAKPNTGGWNDEEWDIGEFDYCMGYYPGNEVKCCIESGGIWTGQNAGEGGDLPSQVFVDVTPNVRSSHNITSLV